jgi:lysophospholipid acyltransferase (LPLAT)-like uncharacterized protein
MNQDWRLHPEAPRDGSSRSRYPVIAALASTFRWRTEGLEHLDAVLGSGHQPVLSFWHGRILPATYFFRCRGIVVITSENFDGEWIAGSSSDSGHRARVRRREARKAPAAADARHGRRQGRGIRGRSRGPARVAQPGAVWLAKATGNPAVPFHLEAERP